MPILVTLFGVWMGSADLTSDGPAAVWFSLGVLVLLSFLSFSFIVLRVLPDLARVSSFTWIKILRATIDGLSSPPTEDLEEQYAELIPVLAARLSDDAQIAVLENCLLELHSSWAPSTDYQTRYRAGWRQTFSDLARHNKDYAWLFPPPSNFFCHLEAHQLAFFKLQLEEWSRVIHSSEPNLLEPARYLFITWNLTSLRQYSLDQLGALASMLEALRKAVAENDLLIDRCLLLNLEELNASRELQRHFFLSIWLPFFHAVPKQSYRLALLDGEKLHAHFADNPDERLIFENFLDVALFSWNENLRKLALGQTAGGSGCVLPMDSSQQPVGSYQLCQFSTMINRRLPALYLARSTGAPEKINEMVNDARQVFSRIEATAMRIDEQVRQLAKSFFNDPAEEALILQALANIAKKDHGAVTRSDRDSRRSAGVVDVTDTDPPEKSQNMLRDFRTEGIRFTPCPAHVIPNNQSPP